MQFYNNIFEKGENNIFYIKIDGEIYQVKFENIVYQINSIHIESMCDFVGLNKSSISTIKLNVASKGEMVWYRHIYSSPFNPTSIYRSIEDCVKEENPIFKRNGFNVVLGDCKEIFVARREFTPKFASWCHNGKDIYGYEIFMLKTYRWDGTKAILERLKTNPNKFKDIVFYNSDWNSCFDLVNEEWLIDDEYANSCYNTYEECVNSNFIKVHTF